jgi:hypothetical protein
VGKLATLESFRLRALIEKTKPSMYDGDIKTYYCSQIPSLKTEMLIHFAMGVFWKGSAISWKALGQDVPRLSFGAYGDAVRKFLLDIGHFPKNMALVVHIDSSPTPWISFGLPWGTKAQQLHFFEWIVTGVRFILIVGKQIPLELRLCCIQNGEHNPIFLVTDIQESMKERFSHTHGSRKIARNVLATYEHFKKLRG